MASPSRFSLRLLGPFECPAPDGSEVAISAAKQRGVLAYLALNHGKGAQRNELASVFWSDRGENQAEPNTASDWHDHGERTTYILPLQGGAYVELEDGTKIPMKSDGTVYVIPPLLRHREVNPGPTAMQAFLVRLGPTG